MKVKNLSKSFKPSFFGEGSKIFGKVVFGKNVWVGLNSLIYGPCKIGNNVYIGDHCIVGFPTRNELKKIRDGKENFKTFKGKGWVWIGDGCLVRSGCVIYSNVKVGGNVEFGHNVLIRENVKIGKNSLIGSYAVVDGNCKIGSNVSIQTGVYISAYTTIKSDVFLGPYCLLLNDKYMKRKKYQLKGPTICKGASIGGNSIIMPTITVGENSMVGAGSVVTKNVKPKTVVAGIPATEIKTI